MPESLNSVIAIAKFVVFFKSVVVITDFSAVIGNSSVMTVEFEYLIKLSGYS